MQLEPVKSAQNVCSKPILRHVNPHIVCGLCDGYLIDATTVIHCLHSYCRGCLLKYLRVSKSKVCPACRYQLNPSQITNFSRDRLLQRLVYKLVPGLYRDEISRRHTFNKTVADVETNNQSRPDNSDVALKIRHRRRKQQSIEMTSEVYTGDEHLNVCLLHCDSSEELGTGDSSDHGEEKLPVPAGDRRYLQCPVGFTVGHLKKYLHFKFGIENRFEVDMFIGKQTLDDCLTLVDVAYCCYGKKVPDVTLNYVVSAVRTPTVLTNCSPSLSAQEHTPSTVLEPAADVDRSKPKSTTTTNRFRTPTSRIRKRMLNDTRFRCTVRNTLADKTAAECLSIPDPPRLIVWSASDRITRPPSTVDLVQVPVQNFDRENTLIANDAEKNHRQSLDETLKCAASAELDAVAAADSASALPEQWLSRARVSAVATETDVINLDEDGVYDEPTGEMSEDGSSDIDGEIRTIAARLTRDNDNADDAASVFSSDEGRYCSSPSMTAPGRAEVLEQSATGFNAGVEKSSRLSEKYAAQASLLTRSNCVTDGICDKVTFSLAKSSHDASLTSSGNSNFTPAVIHGSCSSVVSLAEQRLNVLRTCSVTSPSSLIGPSAILSSAFLSSATSTASSSTSAWNNRIAHSIKLSSVSGPAYICCRPADVSCLVPRLQSDASNVRQSSVIVNVCSAPPCRVSVDAPLLVVHEKPVIPLVDSVETGSKSASLENLVSSSTDSVESASTASDQVTSDLVQQQKQLSETLLLNKETVTEVSSDVRTIELAKSSLDASAPGSSKVIENTPTNAPGIIQVSSEQLLVIKRGSLPGFITRSENARAVVRAESCSDQLPASSPVLTLSSSPMSCSETPITSPNSSSVGTQTNTDLLGRYFKRRMNPISSFIPGCNGRVLRSANVCGNTTGTMGQGLKDRMARPGLKSTPASTLSNRSTSSSSVATTSSSASATTNAVYFASGPQGTPLLVPVSAITSMNLNNKGTFLIALPANFTLQTSSSAPVATTLSVPSVGVSKAAVCPVLAKTGANMTSNRTTAVVLNRTPSGPPLQVIVSPSHVGLTSAPSIKSIHSTVVSATTGGLNRVAPGSRLSRMPNSIGTPRSSCEQVPDMVQSISNSTNLTTVRTPTAARTSQPQTIIYYSRPMVNPGQKNIQAPQSSSVVSSGRGTVSSFNKVIKQPMVRPPVTRVATVAAPMTSSGAPVTRSPGEARNVVMPLALSQKKQTSDDGGSAVPGVAAVCTRGQRMEGAPVSFIRAILERSIASPEAYGSFCMVDDRSSVSPDHVTSTGGMGEVAASSDTPLTGRVHQVSEDLTATEDTSVLSSTAVQPVPTKRSRPDALDDQHSSPATLKRVCLDQAGKTSPADQHNVTMEMFLAKYCKQQNTWPTSVGTTSLSNGCGDVTTLAVAGRDDNELTKNTTSDVTVPFAASSRITRSGMVALPKKIYAYLGSAMSHEHIANQLVPGSPSPPTNNAGASMDSSDGLVPASPTSSATSSRLSIESMTSSDDGPIRQLRLLCSGLRNAVQ